MKKRMVSLMMATVMAAGLAGCSKPEDSGGTVRLSQTLNGAGGRYASSVGEYVLDADSPEYVDISQTADAGGGYGPLRAVDDLDRTLPTAAESFEVGTGKQREVALFYLLWHKQETGPYLFEDVLSQNPDPAKPPTALPWQGSGPYYWGEPLFGYYHTTDTWVMRRHIEMLTHAGVDFLVVDATNDEPYCTQALKFMKLLDEYQRQGWDVPKICFYTNTDSHTRMLQLYNEIYKPGKYPDTWYMYNGKPMIIGIETNAPPAITSFFNMRASQWPGIADVENGFPWIDFREQAKIYKDRDGKNGVISVSVAQNSGEDARFGDNYFYGDTGNRGRSHHDGAANITEDSYLYGYNFQEQWDHAIASDADIAMILEWNEWTAGAWNDEGNRPDKPIAIWDCLNPEYSRDIEPMRGGYFDNYYMQMVANIRKFKGTEKTVVQGGNKTVDVAGSFGQWTDVAVTYRDFAEGAFRRDAVGTGGTRYINTTGRNGMLYAKVAQDASNLYFYVQTQEDISPWDKSEGSWMQLYLNTGTGEGWNGYQYVVNHKASSAAKTTVARYDGGEFKTVGEVSYRVLGNQMMIAVPKGLLGLSGSECSFQFKWGDSTEAYASVEDFYENGDVMPYGRFNYEFNGK